MNNTYIEKRYKQVKSGKSIINLYLTHCLEFKSHTSTLNIKAKKFDSNKKEEINIFSITFANIKGRVIRNVLFKAIDFFGTKINYTNIYRTTKI